MLSKIFNVSAYAFLLGLIACSGITEEGNSFANKYDLWNGANGDSQLSLGYWFSVNDNLSSVEFPTVNGNKLSLDDMDLLVSHCGGLCGTVELGESSAPSAGVGIALASNNSAIDISEWDGLCVSYESELLMKGVLHYKDSGTESLDDMPTVNFDKTGNGIKASRCAKWSDFRQTSMNSSSGVDASKKATSLIFKFFGNAKESGYFNIRGVSSYKHGIENLDSIEIVETPKMDTSACLWNGTSDEISGGNWYSYNDRNDGGASLLYWSAVAPNYKNSIEWLTDEELFKGGLSASVALDKGSASQAYAGIGLKMSVVDISDWNGICVYYMAEKNMRLVLASDSLEKDYVLDASTTLVKKCVTWDDLSSDGLEKNVSDIKFEVNSNENVFNQIRFNIIAIGKNLIDDPCVIDESKVTQ